MAFPKGNILAKGNKTFSGRKHSLSSKWLMIKGHENISKETRMKMSIAQRKRFGVNWEETAKVKPRKLRGGARYKQWREAVFKRDNHTCRKCETRGGHLHAHHVLRFSLYPNQRFFVGNGMTFCVPCHKEFKR